MGVPTVGCGCAVCTSTDPKDRRLRPAVLVRWNDPGLKLLDDPRFRARTRKGWGMRLFRNGWW